MSDSRDRVGGGDVDRGGDDHGGSDGRGRRRFLGALGAVGAAAVAGCLGGTGSGDSGPYGGWVADANGFDGVVDRTGADEVTVKVGAGDGFAFAPAAVKVSPGTTVVWEWTGRGNRHNVVEKGDGYRSDLHAEKGTTFTHTFESVGVSKYYCSPHRNLGMKGVVDVVEE
ncbi:halocyanin domain-containing protein [Halobaculum sp. D14]|uniref:halocyanin domain-containing protein n=1 Tax=Halobaculum sp. D14 TaxID=3421642 RepID=UPI003EB922CD